MKVKVNGNWVSVPAFSATVPGSDDAYTKPSGGIPKTDLASDVQTSLGKADGAYTKPSGGIPKTDLASDVQTSLGKADSAIQDISGKADLTNNTQTITASQIHVNTIMDGSDTLYAFYDSTSEIKEEADAVLLCDLDISQTTGQSTTEIMSQKAVTDAIGNVLVDNAVTTTKIKDGAVTSAKIANGVIPDISTKADLDNEEQTINASEVTALYLSGSDSIQTNGTLFIYDNNDYELSAAEISASISGDVAILNVSGEHGNPIVRNVATPVQDSDVATKQYVDEQISANSGGSGGSVTFATESEINALFN